jgi:excisionase family DNA binding protein
MTAEGTSDLLDVKGAGAYLGVPESFVRRLVLEKRVRYYKLGKYLRFKPSDLDAMVESGRVEPVQERSLVSQRISNTRLFEGVRKRATPNSKKVS